MVHKLFSMIGYDVRKKGKAPTRSFEIDCIDLISTIDPDQTEKVIFDVGANIGQTAIKLSNKLPNASIYSYEPFPSSFSKLKENCSSNENIQCKQIGLSSVTGYISDIDDKNCSQTNRFSKDEINTSVISDKQEIVISTIDKEMELLNLPNLWLLKIDVEGMDLEVLKGASRSLGNKCISWIYIEAGLTSIQRHHVPLHNIFVFLRQYDYVFSGCFELCFPRHYSYCNALFRSSKN